MTSNDRYKSIELTAEPLTISAGEYELCAETMKNSFSTGNVTINKIDAACSIIVESDPKEDDSLTYKRIGDMLYFLDTGKAIPLRKLDKETRKRLKL